jgi:hypothetical protein
MQHWCNRDYKRPKTVSAETAEAIGFFCVNESKSVAIKWLVLKVDYMEYRRSNVVLFS